jgi:hypothetical protein
VCLSILSPMLDDLIAGGGAVIKKCARRAMILSL